MRCATCCRRSQPCSMVASVATRSSGCRSCARPVSARGSSMPRAAPCRWTSTVSSKKCCRSSISRPTSFAARVQDELIGQMSELLGIDYDVLALDLTESESRHRALVSDPTRHRRRRHCLSLGPLRGRRSNQHHPRYSSTFCRPPAAAPTRPEDDAAPSEASAASPAAAAGGLLDEHIISPAPTTERLQSIQRMVADRWAMCCRPTSRPTYCSRFPCRPGPLSHLGHLAYRPWPRHPTACASTSRSSRARSRARPTWTHVSRIVLTASGSRVVPRPRFRRRSRAVLALLVSWPVSSRPTSADVGHFVTDLPALLHGQGQRHDDGARRLSDNTLVKLFRLLRLARRLLDLEAGAVGSGT